LGDEFERILGKRGEAFLKLIDQRSCSEELIRMETEILFDILSKELRGLLNRKQILDVDCGIERILSFYYTFSNDIFAVNFSTNILYICKNNIPSAKLLNGDALPDVILEIKEDKKLEKKIAEERYKTFREKYTPKVIGKEIKDISGMSL